MRPVRVLAFLIVLVPYVTGADTARKPTGANKVVADRIAAVVNDAVILVSELDLRMLPMRAQAMEIADPTERDRRLARLGRETLDRMVDDELVLQAGRTAKLTVDDKELDASIEYIKKQNKLDDKTLAEAMAAQGITRQTLRDDLLRQRAIANFVLPKVQVTDEDVRARYDALARRSKQVSAVNVSQILVALPEHPTEQQQNDARKRAVKAIDRVHAGEPFAKLAAELSDDATTRTTGGMLGWLEPAALDPAWEAVVIAMDKGDLRGPIVGEKGLYVLYANDVKRTQLDPFDKMKEQLASQLRQTRLAKLTQTWLEELRKKAYIEIKLR